MSLELFPEELVGDGRCLSLTHFDNGTDSAGVELMSQGGIAIKSGHTMECA